MGFIKNVLKKSIYLQVSYPCYVRMSATCVATSATLYMRCVPQCGRVKFTYMMYSLRSGCPKRHYIKRVARVYSMLKRYEETTRFLCTKIQILGGGKVCALLE
jgi:hypothetical protein